MTDFDLGEPAPDADDEPKEEQPDETTDTEPNTETTDEPESKHSEDVGPDPSEVDMPGDDDAEDKPDPTETGPAFPYSEVKQSPLYAREETWTEFEDELDFTVTPELRRMGIRDDELREVHDVALEIVMDNIDEIPERLAEKRRES